MRSPLVNTEALESKPRYAVCFRASTLGYPRRFRDSGMALYLVCAPMAPPLGARTLVM